MYLDEQVFQGGGFDDKWGVLCSVAFPGVDMELW